LSLAIITFTSINFVNGKAFNILTLADYLEEEGLQNFYYMEPFLEPKN